MLKLALLAVALVALPTLAEEPAAAPRARRPDGRLDAPEGDPRGPGQEGDPGALKVMEQAGKKGDLAAAAATIDFPVLMVTDDSKGQASAESWSREQWVKVMEPMYAKPMEGKMTHQPVIFLASDSLATLNDVVTMTMGKKSITARNTTILVRKDGQWLVKAMMEGGWGDMMAGPPPEAAAAEPAK